MSSVESNKILTLRYYAELLSNGDLSFIDQYFSPEFEFTNPTHTEPYRGDGFKNLVIMLRGAFPDLKFTVEHLIAEGDTVVGHWTARGTHFGKPLETLRGDLPAKGYAFQIDGVSWLRIQDGKFVEARINEETLGLLRQIGALPSPTSPVFPTSPQDNVVVVKRYFEEVLNQGKVEILPEIMTEEIAHRIPTLSLNLRGLEATHQFVNDLRSAFADLTFRMERQAAEADKVAVRWYFEGTHVNPFMGYAATHKKVTDQGIDIFIFSQGKIAEICTNEDSFGLLRQLGAFGS